MRVHGTNGSGKTSLLRILTGLSQAESGDVYWNDENIDADRASFNENLLYIGHRNGLKADLSAFENLTLLNHQLKQFSEVSVQDALDAVGLSGYETILAHQLSAGQKRRVALARLHLSTAPLWILDEPTTAIDTDGVEAFQRIVEQHANEGGMVIFSSHQALSFEQIPIRDLSLSGA